MHTWFLLWNRTWLLFITHRWFCSFWSFLLHENDFIATLWTEDAIFVLIFIWSSLTLVTDRSSLRVPKFTKIIDITIQIIVYTLRNSTICWIYANPLCQVVFIAFFHWLSLMVIVANRIDSMFHLLEFRRFYFRFAEIRGSWLFSAINSIHTTIHIVLKSICILTPAWNLCSVALSCSFVVNCLKILANWCHW